MSDHFKEPLEKIDSLINKLEANVGGSQEEPKAIACTLFSPPAEAKITVTATTHA